MKICVVGGTGNISASFVRLLLEKGHDVTCYNRGQRSIVPEGARLLVGDRHDRPAFERIMQAEKFDAAYDMICYSYDDALSSIRAFRDVGHFIMCSTVCTYGIDYEWLPVSEDHPLRPHTDYGRGKVAADAAFLEAYYRAGFPATIIKPSTTYGSQQGMLRQVAWDFSWIDRVRKGKPILICGDGKALHQHLHVDDAALCFANLPGKPHTIGQTYNMVRRGFVTWEQYHHTAMRVLGREVELVGVPLADLRTMDIPSFDICAEIFAHNVYYSAEKLFRDVPEFQPRISLEEGMRQVIAVMDREGRIPNSDEIEWEDRIIAAQRQVRTLAGKETTK
jgi:nucleoside-diphosphate-sugar epimerase